MLLLDAHVPPTDDTHRMQETRDPAQRDKTQRDHHPQPTMAAALQQEPTSPDGSRAGPAQTGLAGLLRHLGNRKTVCVAFYWSICNQMLKNIGSFKYTSIYKSFLFWSRVTMGISAFPLGWPWEAQSSPRVARESWGWRSSHCRA